MANAALVLAAGKGTRMHSDKPKVLQYILSEPLLTHVLRALRPIFHNNIWTVIGHQAEMVRKKLADDNLNFIMQAEQKGTGHALMQALPTLIAEQCEYVLVVNGDAPLLQTEMIQSFINSAHKIQDVYEKTNIGQDLVFATMYVPEDNAYGRVVRNQGKIGQDIQAIVERKDYDEIIHGKPTGEVNVGLYLLYVPMLAKLLPLLSNDNQSGEYYLTDLVKLAREHSYGVHAILYEDKKILKQLLGVNTPRELVQAEEILRKDLVERAIDSGVIIHSLDSVILGAEVKLSPGAEIFGPCEIYGKSSVAKGAIINSHCVLRDVHVDEGTEVFSFCYLQESDIGKNSLIGPFARLRPGNHIKEKVKIGNFVELKKSTLSKGAKASHLSYIGDTQVGEAANIGAGTIVCNYDGKNKFPTQIGAKAFIGSNAALVAPVNVGESAVVGAGSVITKDVPDEFLAVARGKQKNLLRKK